MKISATTYFKLCEFKNICPEAVSDDGTIDIPWEYFYMAGEEIVAHREAGK